MYNVTLYIYIENHLGSLARHLHSNVCPTGPPSKYQHLLAVKLLRLSVFKISLEPSIEILPPVVVTVNQISFISVEALDFRNDRKRVVAIANLKNIEGEKTFEASLPQQLDTKWLKFARSQVASW